MSDNVKDICLPGNRGLFLPFTDGEQYIARGPRAFFLAFEMIYCFLGVSILADTFVSAIVTITSKRKRVKGPTGRIATVKVWNDTVANLSLLALGSSAPEIALCTVEVLKNRMFVGKLGVATIIGSGAFNLLVIVAVCVVVIPSTEHRHIENVPAFIITAAFSVIAYIWLGFILVTNTTDVVDIWEAVVTFAFLPVLIWVSYKVDIGDFHRIFPHRFLRFLCGKARPSAVQHAPSLGFASDTVQTQGTSEKQTLEVNVTLREATCSGGEVSCSYHTEELTAVRSYDFEEAEGRLVFPEGVTEQSIKLEILPKSTHKIAREFLVILDDAEGMVRFDPDDDGGSESAILTVTIDPVCATLSGNQLLRFLDKAGHIDQLRLGTSEWVDQFFNVFYCNGSAEEQKTASRMDWCWHILCLPWNVLFSLVPPVSYFGGWVCFLSSLVFLFFIAAILTDLAEMFGCVVEVADIVTAITFVSVGTSVPDLFTSLSAARQEPTADASVVNVTGSNSVNVFLGIGLPWTISAVYWKVNGRTPEWEARYPEVAARMPGNEAALVVDSLHLGYGVLIFTSATVACISILLLRRKLLGAELGGPFMPKVCTFIGFLIFWFGFIVVVSYRSIRLGKATKVEWYCVLSMCAVMECLAMLWVMWVIVRHWRQEKNAEESSPSTAQAPNEGTESDKWSGAVAVSVVPCTDSRANLPGECELLQ